MATAVELTFINSIRVAEGVRQVAIAAAFTTNAVNGAIPAANLAAYVTALQAADNAYVTSCNSAAQTLGAAGYTIPNSGTPNPGNVVPSMAKLVPTPSVIGNGTATMGAIG